MSEEKEFCKHNTHESHYCGDCHKELIASKDAEIKSLESGLKEAENESETRRLRIGCDGVTITDLRKRLSQAEAELDAVVKERDLYNEKYLELEKELSDFKKFHDEEFFGWEKLTSNLKAKLSQAEAENETLKLCNKNANALIADGADEAEKIVARLNARLSHLMDVAGKMAVALKPFCDGDCEFHKKCPKGCFHGEAKLALAEWDGIKK